MKSTTLRIAALIVGACGLLGLLAFGYYWAEGVAWHWSSLNRLAHLSLPYFLVALAAALSRTRTLAALALVASFAIAALGVWTYSSLARTGPSAINDITLLTFPLQRILSYFALAAAVIGFIIHRVRHASNVA